MKLKKKQLPPLWKLLHRAITNPLSNSKKRCKGGQEMPALFYAGGPLGRPYVLGTPPYVLR